MLVVLFATPLWYANAVHFREQLDAALASADGRPGAVVLDAIGMSDLDYTGSRSLREVLDSLDLSTSRSRSPERESGTPSLARSGLLERIGDHRLFASVGEAVTALRQNDPDSLSKPSDPDGHRTET